MIISPFPTVSVSVPHTGKKLNWRKCKSPIKSENVFYYCMLLFYAFLKPRQKHDNANGWKKLQNVWKRFYGFTYTHVTSALYTHVQLYVLVAVEEVESSSSKEKWNEIDGTEGEKEWMEQAEKSSEERRERGKEFIQSLVAVYKKYVHVGNPCYTLSYYKSERGKKVFFVWQRKWSVSFLLWANCKCWSYHNIIHIILPHHNRFPCEKW